MPHVRELAGLRYLLGDLESKSRTMPGFGQEIIQRDMTRIRGEIAYLEGVLATPLRANDNA